jgi:DNA-binding winged helix-turn-helix (wHTH) protein
VDAGLRLCFGEFELWPRERRLLRQGREEALGGRAFDLLLALVEGRGRVVPNVELIERVWPGTAVEPNNLQVQIWTLRQLLGRDAIATVARRGYRITLPVAAWSVAAANTPLAMAPVPGETACAGLIRQHVWLTVLMAPGQRSEPLHGRALSLAHDLGRTLWSLDARHLVPSQQAPAWLHRLWQGQVLLWLENAHDAPVEALAVLCAERSGALRVLAAAPRPLGVPGEHVCAAADLALTPATAAGDAAPAAAATEAGLRWHVRATKDPARDR